MSGVVGDICEVIVDYAMANQRLANSFGFLQVTGGVDKTNLANAFKTAMVKNTSGGLLYSIADDLSSAKLTVRDIKPGTEAPVELTYTAVAGSNGTSEPVPPQAAMVLNWKTNLAGRSYRGRTYLAGLCEDAQNVGTLTAAQVTNITTIVTNLLAVFGPGGTNGDWRFSIISRIANGVPRATPIATQVVTGVVRPTVYTQRRRTIGVGI